MPSASEDELEKLRKLKTELESRLVAIEEEQKTEEKREISLDKKWQFESWRNQ